MLRPVFAGLERHALIGMVHLGPLLDKGVALADVEAKAVADAIILRDVGFDAIVVENFGDTPFFPDEVPPHTIAAMTRCIMAVRHVVGALPLGVNVLRNDARGALAIAAATGSQAIRVNVHSGAAVTDQGLVMGRAHETVRMRRSLAPDVRIWADVRVKHAAPLAERELTEEALELAERAEADAIIVSGAKTGGATDPARLAKVRAAVHVPILVGSGATIETLDVLLPVCDGLIVGSAIKVGDVTSAVDARKAQAFVDAARSRA